MKIRLLCSSLLLGLVAAALSLPVHGQESLVEPSEEFSTATIIGITEGETETFEGITRTQQTLTLRIDNGPEKGKEVSIENGALGGRADTQFAVGENVVLNKQTDVAGGIHYMIREKYRLPSIIWLTIFFVALSVVFGRLTGITAIAGLAVSIIILVGFVIPRIVAGSDPLLISFIGCILIACSSLYLAHGFSRRTSVALLSTVVTLVIAVLLDLMFVYFSKLYGMGSEESLYLQIGLLQNVNLQGLLLGGILIGCLGVLDDVTTAQTAAIDEISKANPTMSFAELSTAGRSVGKEHIASLINTLALAYVGASLPLLLLLDIQSDYPLWVTINGEFFAEEIIRTLVGSATLLVAVPISTWFAAYFLQGGRGGGASSGHSHSHGIWVSKS